MRSYFNLLLLCHSVHYFEDTKSLLNILAFSIFLIFQDREVQFFVNSRTACSLEVWKKLKYDCRIVGNCFSEFILQCEIIIPHTNISLVKRLLPQRLNKTV